ncbi:MAG TPA: hypothetical protein VNX01_03110 [Bacteroidia bacterium]|jgi:hypothetical protein|nr:hypothetical protein [Bacteroidia bacterium]
MFKKLFKSKKEITTAKTEKAKVEKLDAKELGNVVGGGGGTPTTTTSGGKTSQDSWDAK